MAMKVFSKQFIVHFSFVIEEIVNGSLQKPSKT